jgi:hypothetical protein
MYSCQVNPFLHPAHISKYQAYKLRPFGFVFYGAENPYGGFKDSGTGGSW